MRIRDEYSEVTSSWGRRAGTRTGKAARRKAGVSTACVRRGGAGGVALSPGPPDAAPGPTLPAPADATEGGWFARRAESKDRVRLAQRAGSLPGPVMNPVAQEFSNSFPFQVFAFL